MTRRRWLAAAGAAVALAVSGAAQADQPVRLAISCAALGVELRLCTEGVRAWEEKTGNRVTIVSTPNSSTERLALYLQVLASRSDDIDVLQVDVVWPGILANHLIDLKPYMGDDPAAHFSALIENDTVDGRLVAMPWWTDAGVLYYRRDLLEKHGFSPPATWQEMTEIARQVQRAERAAGHEGLWGFVWQGRAYEGLTCNALEWIDAFGGGMVIDEEGRITVDNPRATAALELAAGWVGDISPRGVLNYDEEAARGVFQSGNAVFMRNWPFAWALAQGADSPVRGKVGVVALPSGGAAGKSTGTLGGWHLAVSRYSRHPEVAADLVRFLTGREEQKRRAIEGSYNPTIVALYQDRQVLEANPFFGELFSSFENAVARPARIAGPWYNRVSYAFWSAAHDILAGQAEPAPRLAALEAELRRIKQRGRW